MNSPMTERFEMRLSATILEEVDAWRARQSDLPSRAEAVRRLIEVGLAGTRRVERDVRLSDGEKLILLTLRDISKQLKLKGGETDLDFIAAAIFGGHSWGLKWQFSGVFHDHEDSRTVVSEVVDVLDMWSFLETGYDKLSNDEKRRVANECSRFGSPVKFRGFDGNNEAEYIGVARFLIDQLDRFTEFKGRDLNSHFPAIETYRRMVLVFDGIRPTLAGRELRGDEITAILKAG